MDIYIESKQKMQVYQLYSDGNYFPRAKKSGFGGHIQTPNGETLVEYTEQIRDPKYAYSFELLGIIRGLQIAKTHNITHIVSHCDDKNTTRKLKEIFDDNIFNISPSMKPELYREIMELSKSFKSIKFQYVPRTQNKHADSLSRKYSALMEENFLKKYSGDLDHSQEKFESETKTNKRIFFSHKSVIRNSHKINPFLVANIRNRRVKKISREQQSHNYHYLFNEIFTQNDTMILRSFYYDNENKLNKTFEHSFKNTDSHITQFCNFLASNLKELNTEKNVENIWMASNYSVINAFFEQKDKLPNDDWESFLNVHKALDGFKKVFFHHFPFEHKYSEEIAPVEKAKEKLDEQILNLDDLIEQLSQNSAMKDQNKCFGAIIRHQLRNYKGILERELEEIEINEIIDATVASLNAKGFTNLPVIQKIKSK